MYRIALILPYFGKFPEYFQLFLNSCASNPSVDWLLFTDISDPYDFPENVKVIPKTFEDIRKLAQEKFDFQITLNSPYKLCDYRPAYGYLFSTYLDGYDFWGHCDLDLLFGNIRGFFSDEQLDKYDKIGHLGHLTLYRNTPEINTLFMTEVDGRVRYREVFTTDNSCIFDEWDDLSINKMFLRCSKRIWLWKEFFDAYPFDDNLVRVTRKVDMQKDYAWSQEISPKGAFVTWENGKIFVNDKCRGDWVRTELAYVHFQKRDMAMNCSPNEEKILCLPYCFVPLPENIPLRYEMKAALHRIINVKRWKKWCLTLRYQLIVTTAPIRHKFRRR